jgi:hypothetical protein
MGSAINPEVVGHSRHNLRIREFVSGVDIDVVLLKALTVPVLVFLLSRRARGTMDV